MTQMELKILEVLWAKDEPLSMGELLLAFNAKTGKNWKKQTMNTFLVRMQQKALVGFRDGERYRLYFPLIGQDVYAAESSKKLLHGSYGGSITRMVVALCGNGKPNPEEIKKLRQKLDEWEKQ